MTKCIIPKNVEKMLPSKMPVGVTHSTKRASMLGTLQSNTFNEPMVDIAKRRRITLASMVGDASCVAKVFRKHSSYAGARKVLVMVPFVSGPMHDHVQRIACVSQPFTRTEDDVFTNIGTARGPRVWHSFASHGFTFLIQQFLGRNVAAQMVDELNNERRIQQHRVRHGCRLWMHPRLSSLSIHLISRHRLLCNVCVACIVVIERKLRVSKARHCEGQPVAHDLRNTTGLEFEMWGSRLRIKDICSFGVRIYMT